MRTDLAELPPGLTTTARLAWQYILERTPVPLAEQLEVAVATDPVASQLSRVLACSPFVAELCRRQPALLLDLLGTGELQESLPETAFRARLQRQLSCDGAGARVYPDGLAGFVQVLPAIGCGDADPVWVVKQRGAVVVAQEHQRAAVQVHRDQVERCRDLAAPLGAQIVVGRAGHSAVAYTVCQQRHGLAGDDVADGLGRFAAPLAVNYHHRQPAMRTLDHFYGVTAFVGRVLADLGDGQLQG